MVVRFQGSFDAADPQQLAAFWEQSCRGCSSSACPSPRPRRPKLDAAVERLVGPTMVRANDEPDQY